VAAITRASTLMSLAAAQTLELALLQDAKQLWLQLERQFANLVEEDGRPIRDFEATRLPRQSTGERALFPAEQFRLDQARRQRRAVDLDHRPIFLGARVVDRLREHFFSASGFPQQQYS
jgi:hypothetical protein